MSSLPPKELQRLIQPTRGQPLQISNYDPIRVPIWGNPRNAGKHVFRYLTETDEYICEGRVETYSFQFARSRLQDLLADLAIHILDKYRAIYGGIIPERDQNVATLRRGIATDRGLFNFTFEEILFLSEIARVSGKFTMKGWKTSGGKGFGEDYFGDNAVELVRLFFDRQLVGVRRKWTFVLEEFYPLGVEALETEDWHKDGRARSEEEAWKNLLCEGEYRDVVVYFIEKRSENEQEGHVSAEEENKADTTADQKETWETDWMSTESTTTGSEQELFDDRECFESTTASSSTCHLPQPAVISHTLPVTPQSGGKFQRMTDGIKLLIDTLRDATAATEARLENGDGGGLDEDVETEKTEILEVVDPDNKGNEFAENTGDLVARGIGEAEIRGVLDKGGIIEENSEVEFVNAPT